MYKSKVIYRFKQKQTCDIDKNRGILGNKINVGLINIWVYKKDKILQIILLIWQLCNLKSNPPNSDSSALRPKYSIK